MLRTLGWFVTALIVLCFALTLLPFVIIGGVFGGIWIALRVGYYAVHTPIVQRHFGVRQ